MWLPDIVRCLVSGLADWVRLAVRRLPRPATEALLENGLADWVLPVRLRQRLPAGDPAMHSGSVGLEALALHRQHQPQDKRQPAASASMSIARWFYRTRKIESRNCLALSLRNAPNFQSPSMRRKFTANQPLNPSRLSRLNGSLPSLSSVSRHSSRSAMQRPCYSKNYSAKLLQKTLEMLNYRRLLRNFGGKMMTSLYYCY